MFYFGNVREIESDSLWFDKRRVNPVDSRFHFRPNGQLTCEAQIHARPQAFAWGGNWALSAEACPEGESLFNENFVGWGLEDVDLANRLVGVAPKLGELQIPDSDRRRRAMAVGVPDRPIPQLVI